MSITTLAVGAQSGQCTRYRYGSIDFWADEGSIHWVNRDTGEEQLMAPMNLRQRAKVFFRMSERDNYRSDRRVHVQGARDMIACCQESERQGDPRDPAVHKEQSDARRKLRLSLAGIEVPSTKLIVPGGV